MKRLLPICVLFGVLVFTGCAEPKDPLPQPGDPPVVNGAALMPFDRVKKENQRDFILVVRINLITVQIPIGSVSNSEQLWGYLDEEPVGARVGSALSSNGIRVGLGRKDAWKDISGILQQLTGEPLNRTTLLVPPGAPMPIVFKPQQKEQTIFTYRRDESLFGRDYPAGDNVLMTMATINFDEPSAVWMTATPVVRSSQRRRRYVKQAGEYALTSEPIYYHLGDLGFRFKVPRGDFILIGPDQQAQQHSSPGYHFLVHNRQALEFETVVIIAPEVFAAPARKKD
ncbi:MAG: hypothetical protein SVV80_10610 [Planctomycetota bacterium]|nr:hypothetical protein [Planctomycetota bacterium]